MWNIVYRYIWVLFFVATFTPIRFLDGKSSVALSILCKTAGGTSAEFCRPDLAISGCLTDTNDTEFLLSPQKIVGPDDWVWKSTRPMLLVLTPSDLLSRFSLSYVSRFHNAYETRNSKCSQEISKRLCGDDIIRLCRNQTEYIGFVISSPMYRTSIRLQLNFTEIDAIRIIASLGNASKDNAFGSFNISVDDLKLDFTLQNDLLMVDAANTTQEGFLIPREKVGSLANQFGITANTWTSCFKCTKPAGACLLTGSNLNISDQVEQYRSLTIASKLDPTRTRLSFVDGESDSYATGKGYASYQSIKHNTLPACLKFQARVDATANDLPIRDVGALSFAKTGFIVDRLPAPGNLSGVFFMNISNAGPLTLSVVAALTVCDLTSKGSTWQSTPKTLTTTIVLEPKSASIARVPATFVEFDGIGTCGFYLKSNHSAYLEIAISFAAHLHLAPPPPPPLLQLSTGVTRLYVVEFSTTLLSFQFDMLDNQDTQLKQQPFILSYQMRIASYASVPTSAVMIMRLRPGSVIVDTRVSIKLSDPQLTSFAQGLGPFLKSQPDNYLGNNGTIIVSNLTFQLEPPTTESSSRQVQSCPRDCPLLGAQTTACKCKCKSQSNPKDLRGGARPAECPRPLDIWRYSHSSLIAVMTSVVCSSAGLTLFTAYQKLYAFRNRTITALS